MHYNARCTHTPATCAYVHRYSAITDPELFKGVIRVKGCFWTAAEPSTRIDYSVVGKNVNLIIDTMWAQVGLEMLSSGLEDGQFKDQEAAVDRALTRLNSNVLRLKDQGSWHPDTHDRRVELVFIGDAEEMDVESIRAAVNHALLTEEEAADLQGMRGGSLLTSSNDSADELANPFAGVPRCALNI